MKVWRKEDKKGVVRKTIMFVNKKGNECVKA